MTGIPDELYNIRQSLNDERRNLRAATDDLKAIEIRIAAAGVSGKNEDERKASRALAVLDHPEAVAIRAAIERITSVIAELETQETYYTDVRREREWSIRQAQTEAILARLAVRNGGDGDAQDAADDMAYDEIPF
jgi:hypothetical protein